MDNEKASAYKEASNYPSPAMRELTIGELLDRRIEKAQSLTKTLLDLKQSLPSSYLNSGASRITSFIEL